MTVFDAALSTLHTDPNLSVSALWREGGAGAAVPVRVIVSAPDVNADFTGAPVKRTDWQITMRAVDAPTVRAGDLIQIGAEVFKVLTAEMDAERLSWTVMVRR